MSRRFPKLLAWHTRRTVEQLGLPGVVGLVLLAFCAMFYFSAAVPVGKELRSLESEAVQSDVRRTSTQARQQPDRQLEAFYESFPKVVAAPDALGRLHEAAVAQGVTLEQGEYHLVRNGADKLVRYEMVLPIKGDYMRLRRFLSQALADMPYVALGGVEFQRHKISDTTLEAQVKMTLFLVEG